MELRKASKRQIKLKMGLSGASGFGKTYSALLLAKGLVGDWSKIAMIDTENGSGSLYSHLGDYNVLELEPPYNPERYIEAINACEKAGIECCIIDSISHEWEGEGGILSIHEKATEADPRKNSYTSWAKVTPRHNAFVNTILQSKMHILCTVRRKQDYEMTKNDQGKVVVVKAGTKEITRENFEYELTLSFEFIGDNHYVKASKDRTGLFMGSPEFIISEDTGKKIKEWCESGEQVKETTDSVIAEYNRMLNTAASLLSKTQFEKLQPDPAWTLKDAKDRLSKLKDFIAREGQKTKSEKKADKVVEKVKSK